MRARRAPAEWTTSAGTAAGGWVVWKVKRCVATWPVITKRSSSAVLDSSSALVIAASLLASPVARAQQDSARLAGTVFSSSNGQPVAGVTVALRGTPVFDVSDTAGSFTLAGLPSGQQVVRIRYGDTVSYDHRITLRPAQTLTLSVMVAVDAVELSPIVVEAKTTRAERSLVGFYDRRRGGYGRYYTLEQIEHSPGLRALLIGAGVHVNCGQGHCLPLGSSNNRTCVMALFFNGLRLAGDDLDLIHLDEVAGVEVYVRPVDVPHEFRAGLIEGCGAILLWSR
jgi:hypothetical protein